MGSAKRDAWDQFYQQVVTHGGDWPRALWLAALEDALAAALPADSELLAHYRQDVSELRRLERAPERSHRDLERIAWLDAEIQQLIGAADDAIRPAQPEVDDDQGLAAVPPAGAPRRHGLDRPSAVIAGVVVLCAAALGASYYHHARVVGQMERELGAIQDRLAQEVAALRVDLESRVGPAAAVEANLSALQAELATKVGIFDATMSETVLAITTLGDSVVSELERRISEQDGVAKALRGLEARAAELGRGLDDVGAELATLERRLPALDQGLLRLTDRLVVTQRGFDRAARQVATITAEAPEVALWLEGRREELARELDTRRQAVGDLGVEIAALEGKLDDTRAHLAGLQGALDQDGARIEPQGGTSGHGIEAVAVRADRIIQPIAGVGPAAGAIEDSVQQRVDALLSELAEKADLAVMRSEDVMQRAQGEARRRVETEAEEVVDGLSAAAAQHLATLSERASAAEAELEQARLDLIASWQQLDLAVADRHQQVLSELDQNAETLEGRVQEFLEALEVIVARSQG